MKKQMVFLLIITVLIISAFSGCRYLPGASSGANLNSTVSGVVSKVESDTKGLGSQVSEVVSDVQSGGQELASQASGTISAMTSSK
ncbi:hypothetical protein [Clostridium sp. KNHs216]|uniref:hypothetical protein n=1 Tax=Eubacteriales TaxID=186802 RepID=UPI00056F6416|nr:hypothetical protein [Clostridium sp. KNHs216]MBE6831019.1 hypothetical protein [Oscillospiraceae bacterium]TQI66467.1 hypothetical protein LY85_1135 [Clostridium sp. KNHs216]